MKRKKSYQVFRINSEGWIHAAETGYGARELRSMVSKFNDEYGTKPENCWYILSGVQGYKVTNDLEEIRDAIEHDEYVARKAMNRIQKRKRGLKRLLNRRIHGGELA